MYLCSYLFEESPNTTQLIFLLPLTDRQRLSAHNSFATYLHIKWNYNNSTMLLLVCCNDKNAVGICCWLPTKSKKTIDKSKQYNYNSNSNSAWQHGNSSNQHVCAELALVLVLVLFAVACRLFEFHFHFQSTYIRLSLCACGDFGIKV